jgi:hypothetical protein
MAPFGTSEATDPPITLAASEDRASGASGSGTSFSTMASTSLM